MILMFSLVAMVCISWAAFFGLVHHFQKIFGVLEDDLEIGRHDPNQKNWWSKYY